MENIKIKATAEEIVKMMMDTINILDNHIKEKIAKEDFENLERLCGEKFILEHMIENVTEQEPIEEEEEYDSIWFE